MNVVALVSTIPGASVDEGYGPVTVDVPVDSWGAAVSLARSELGCDVFDFLTAVDEVADAAVVCHLVRSSPFGHLILRTRVADSVASVAGVFAGAAWHERETAEMFGITFVGAEGKPLNLEPLLLPPGFEGHPLRKDFALQSRLDRPWPGAKDPGE